MTEPRFITAAEAMSDYEVIATNVVRVDPTGNDSKGVVGDMSKPFLTVQVAVNAIITAGGNGVIDVGANQFNENISIALTASAQLTFVGHDIDQNVSTAFHSLTVTGGQQIALLFEQCSLSQPIAGNITSDGDLSLYAESANLGGASIVCTKDAGALLVGSYSNSLCNVYSIGAGDSNALSALTIFGVGAYSGGGQISAPNGVTTFIINSCNKFFYPDTNTQSLFSINAPGATLIASQSILKDVTIGRGTFVDSRAIGTITSIDPIVYQDYLLNPALMDFSTLPQATSDSGLNIGQAWIDTTGGLNIVKVKLA